MTISQQIVQSFRTGSQVAGSGEGEEHEIFDIEEHLRSSSKKVLLQRINFTEARQPYNFNLNKLKSKYVILNPSQSGSSKYSTTMSPALKVNGPSITENSPQDGIPTPKTVLFSAEKIELTWKKPMRAGAGLSNLGNTCFLNSSLQCLAYTAPLANYLIHSDHRKHCRVNGQFCMLCAMQQQLYHIHSNLGGAIKPMHILKNLRMIAKHLHFGRQEDAHEFIRYSVDAMQKSCLFGFSSKMDVHIKATTPVHQIFGGYLRSRVQCHQCKSVSDTYDPFLDLSLDINKQGCGDLQRCFEMFVRAEVLQGDNAYKCMQCKSTVQAFKKFSIHRAPNILMLQLKRFSNFMGNKINKDLAYPSKLNIGQYMSNKPEGGPWYELYAVLVHSGFSCQSGHYYAYAKAPNGHWYCFNDSSVHQVSVTQALSQQAYLLFYSRNPKASAQLGSLKTSTKTHIHNSGLSNGVMSNGVTSQKVHTRPLIGPRLPPGFKIQKEYSFQSTSSSSDTGSPAVKQPNCPKVIRSPSSIKPSGTTNGYRTPLQFTIKPKLTLSAVKPNSKLTNSGQSCLKTTKPQCFVKQNGASHFKPSESRYSGSSAKTDTSGSIPSPILNKLCKDSNMLGASSSSTSTSYSSLSSSTSNTGSAALKALVSYSSGDDSDDDYDTPLGTSYGSLSSTLNKLRNQSVEPSSGKKISVKETVIPPVASMENDNTSKHTGSHNGGKIPEQSNGDLRSSEVNNIKRNGENYEKDEGKNDSMHSSGHGNVSTSQKTNGTIEKNTARAIAPKEKENPSQPSTPEKVRMKSTQQDGKYPLCSAKNTSRKKQDTLTQREPILHLLTNEINSNTNFEHKKDDKTLNKTDLAEQRGSLQENRIGDHTSIASTGNGVKGHIKFYRNKVRDPHEVIEERTRHHSTDSTSLTSPLNKNEKNGKSGYHHNERTRPPSPEGRKLSEKSQTLPKKRKRDKSNRGCYSDEYCSDDSYRSKEKHRKSGKIDHATPQKKKKHSRKHFHSSLKRSHSKSNGTYSDDSDRDTSVEKLYCDKEEYKQSLKRKAKKDKRRRLKERQILQSSINEESPKLDRDRSQVREVNGKGKSLRDRSQESSYSREHHGERSPHVAHKHHNKGVKKEKCNGNGRVHKKEEKQNGKILKSPTKDRPNILAQLLKQSSGKAYGAKVDTWNGEESLVEKDAQQTWTEQRTSLTDDWNREYDKGKVKKHKDKDRWHKNGPVHNLFQKFQNIKNQRNGA